MLLRSLRMQNFRQHADTRIAFERGLTGIIGPNGAGKSTILEAIAWALYGNAAARGNRDSIRFSRATARSSVRVELEFELAGHRYLVVRGLTSAECFLDGDSAPIASTISGVSELLQRRLGMTRSEFFHTYFTGQKDLDVMAALGPTERAKFLSRVLGYDRLTSAQELVRERNRAVKSETTGLKQGMPDSEQVARAISDSKAKLDDANARFAQSEHVRAATTAQLAQLSPRWEVAQAERDRAQSLGAELRVAESELQSLVRESERVDADLATIAAAIRERTPLAEIIVPISGLRVEIARLDELAGAEARRQTLLERERTLADEEARFAERIAKLETAPQFERDTTAQLQTLRNAVAELERETGESRTAWTRDRQEAETRLESLRTQYADLAEQRARLEGLGEESPCPTCGRPLGASYRNVVELLVEQLETVSVDSKYYQQRVDQLSKLPEALEQLDERRRTRTQELAAAERRLVKIQAALQELTTATEQRTRNTSRLAETRAALEAIPPGYDRERHTQLRAELGRLADIESRITRLNVQAEREPAANADKARVVASRANTEQRIGTLAQQRQTLSHNDDTFAAVRDGFEQAASAARRAELDGVTAAAEVDRARAAVENADRERVELERLQARFDVLETERRLHEELDRAYTELRTDLNQALRPELSEISSAFLDVLTDGRYSALEFDEDYTPIVQEDGLPKPVISGGEEDLCNLVLRLAISQMIAERAGQSFSLLILDEIFGSLDDARRENVVDLLRRLHDRFEQVIVITHIEQVREGLDRVLIVRYNEETGAATVEAAQGGEVDAAEVDVQGDDIFSTIT